VTEDDLKTPATQAEQPSEKAFPGDVSPSDADGAPTVPLLPTTRPVDRKWGDGGTSRWATLGCGAGVLVLVALLAVGISITKRTAWLTFERSQKRLISAVELRNEPAERLRTRRNLDRFNTQLRISRDPYPLMGDFMKRVRAVLGDGSLDSAEVEAFNEFLETTFPSAAPTP